MSFYITTPIYYPNGEPHLGSVYTTVICDVLARYHRLRGEQTFFLTGTDEHGTKMVKAAAAAGVEPMALATKYADTFRSAWTELNISNDDFIRTTEPRHKQAVAAIVQAMLASGDIYLGGYEGWYDEGQEQFVTETEAKTNEYKSAISGKPLTRYAEPSYFFTLAKYVPKIIEHIEANPSFIVPQGRRNEVLSKLRGGVEDLSISRATLKWGIAMPNDPAHVVYVWIDALTNYVTALGYPGGGKLFDAFWPAQVHVIGKDILWFHAVYWPAMLMSLGLPLPATIAAHGWWVSGGMKAGKSTGGITTLPELRELIAQYGLDVLKYHLLRAAPFGADLEWSIDEYEKSASELANVVGNLLNRTLTMVGKYRNGTLPATTPLAGSQGNELSRALANFAADIDRAYTTFDLQRAVLLPIELARAANAYIDVTRPFTLAKDPAKSAELDVVLADCVRACYVALVGLLSVMPDKAAAGLAQLNVDVAGKTIDALLKNPPAAGHTLGSPSPLFVKPEPKKSN